MLRSFTKDAVCKISKQKQIVTVYFEKSNATELEDLNSYKKHSARCDNASCELNATNACPVFKNAHP